MTDLKIPNLNKNSDKYLFKKKLSLRRKSKSKLLKESFIMLLLSIIIIYLNYLIPNKLSIFNNFLKNFSMLLNNILDSLSYVYEISLGIFIIISTILITILILGSASRMFKVIKRKTKGIKFK